jgi:hypothetical protein
MTCAQRQKRVFGINYRGLPGQQRSPWLSEKILTHLDAEAAAPEVPRRPPCQTPSRANLFY